MPACRQCKTDVDDAATVCPECGHLVGVPFLSIGITGIPEDSGPNDISVSRKEDFGDQDALIVGKLSGEGDFTSFHGNSSERFTPIQDSADFLTAPTEDVERPVSPVPIYVDQETADLLKPEAVLRVVEGVALAERSPLEQHIALFLDGKRPVARVAKKANLGDDDLRIALALLADAGVVELAGVVSVPGAADPASRAPVTESARARIGAELEGELDDDEEEEEEPTKVDAAAPGAAPDEFVLELPSDALTPLPLQQQTEPEPAAAAPEMMPAPAPAPAPAAPPAVPGMPGAPSSGSAIEVRPAMPGGPTRKVTPRPKPRPAPRPAPAAPAASAPADIEDVPLEAISGAGVVILDSDPKDVKLYKHACIKEHEGDIDTAMRLLRHALKLNPRAAILHNRLGVILATRLHEYRAATDALLTAVEIEPDNATYKNNLAKVMEAAPDDTLNFGGQRGRKKPSGLRDALKKRLF
jgi:hypothetical protein